MRRFFHSKANFTILENESFNSDSSNLSKCISRYFKSENLKEFDLELLQELKEKNSELFEEISQKSEKIIDLKNPIMIEEMKDFEDNLQFLDLDLLVEADQREIYENKEIQDDKILLQKFSKIEKWIFRNREDLKSLDSNFDSSFIKYLVVVLKIKNMIVEGVQKLSQNKDLFKDNPTYLAKFTYSLTIPDQELPADLKSMSLESLKKECSQNLRKSIKKARGFRTEDPLFQIFRVGLQNLPEMVDYLQQGTDEENEPIGNELPFTISLEKSLYFHSTLICPVSKETCSAENRPMLFDCGHVVSENSINKMRGLDSMLQSERESSNVKVKCPTCPNRQELSKLRIIHY